MTTSAIVEELRGRMARPQRHRLLQGYPAVPLMQHAVPPTRGTYGHAHVRAVDGALWEPRSSKAEQPAHVDVDRRRALIVGVIPHTMCTPKVRGCGFCTFPHDRFSKSALHRSLGHCLDDTAQLVAHVPALSGRRVDALYFGGGTANLTPVADLTRLFDSVAEHFDVTGSEVTLEGVPSMFTKKLVMFGEDRIAWLRSLPVRHRRVSMGVQTFDAAQIARMGRDAFGDRSTVERVVRAAHDAGMTASADFLFNLPGQSRASMLDDVTQAVACDLDQICVYHLVLYAGLGTAWSFDAELLATLPSVDDAAANFLAVRERLLTNGYVQTTLTNFERRAVRESPRRFMYEDLSFSPFTSDGVGVGPLAISTIVDVAQKRAVKTVRPKLSRADGLWFAYDADDLELFCFVRSLPRLVVERAPFRALFGTDLVEKHRAAFDALVDAALVDIDDASVKLTPRGMFYADAVVGLVTSSRAAALRAQAAGATTMSMVQAHAHSFMG